MARCIQLAAFFIFTALAQAQTEAYRFAVVGHIRGGPGNGNIPTEKLERLTDELRSLELDFVVLTGDLVWGDIYPDGEVDGAAIRRDWEALDKLLERVGAPIHRAPGNHDVWDPTTRDIWLERYGPLHRTFEHRGSQFVLLNSCWTPTGATGRTPGMYIRGAPLPSDQLEFLRTTLEGARDASHVFVLMHHMLWWEDDAPWWREAHPLLRTAPVRSVIAGDMGPFKFSRLERDGIEYVQSTIDYTDRPPLVMLRNREESRGLLAQLDNYLVVHVDGPRVRHELRVIEAFESDTYSPQVWREIYEYDKGSLARRVFNRVNTPERAMTWLVRIGLGAAAAGSALTAFVVWILRRRRSA